MEFLMTYTIMIGPLVVLFFPIWGGFLLWEYLANQGKDIMDKNHCSKPQTSILKREKETK